MPEEMPAIVVDIFAQPTGEPAVWLESTDNRQYVLCRLLMLCIHRPGDYFAASNAEIIASVSLFRETSPASLPAMTQMLGDSIQ